MGSLRKTVEADLSLTLEGDFGLPVELVYPNGDEQIYAKGSTTKKLMGSIRYDTKEFNLLTGGSKLVPVTAVTLRITSLDQTLTPGAPLVVRIPSYPDEEAPKLTFMSVVDNQTAFGRSIGIVTLYPQRVTQTPPPVP